MHVVGENLSADQLGELCGKVMPMLCEGETFNLAEVSTKIPEVEQFWILGNRGTTALATMDDKGWRVRRMP